MRDWKDERIWVDVVRDVVDRVLVEKVLGDDPGRVCDDVVHPSAPA